MKLLWRIVLGLMLTTPLPAGEKSDDSRETIVLIHGMMLGRATLWPAYWSIDKSTYNAVNWGYPSTSKYIYEHGEDLVKDLAAIAKANPGRPIHFITHSMGGIVLRAALNHRYCPPEARNGRICMIAPPNQGAVTARFFSDWALARFLLGDKAWFEFAHSDRGLDYLGHIPDTASCLIIAGTFGISPIINGLDDGLVGVDETRLTTPHTFRTSFSGHRTLAWNPFVIAQCNAFIAQKKREE